MKTRLCFEQQPPLEDYPDLAGFLDRIRGGLVVGVPKKGQLFDVDEWLHITRAPGRLDVIEGFLDSSGGMVFQLPIKEACSAAGQMRSYYVLLQVVSRSLGKQETVLAESLYYIGARSAS